jgi:dihydrofolate reductase
MKISLVVAVSENQVIGKDNRLLWKLPNDMKFFKNTTWAMPVIMGRKTYESLGKPLNGRTNIVLTKKADWSAPGALTVHDWKTALSVARDTDAKEVFVIGGGDIYQQSMEFCHRVYLTRVHTNIEGDTFFPELPPDQWRLHSRLDFPADEKHAYAYSFEVWDSNGNDLNGA